MSKIGKKFTTRDGRTVHYLEKHQDIAMEFTYYDDETGLEFDVRELPDTFIGADRVAIGNGDREAHRRAIQAAMKADHNFKYSA